MRERRLEVAGLRPCPASANLEGNETDWPPRWRVGRAERLLRVAESANLEGNETDWPPSWRVGRAERLLRVAELAKLAGNETDCPEVGASAAREGAATARLTGNETDSVPSWRAAPGAAQLASFRRRHGARATTIISVEGGLVDYLREPRYPDPLVLR